MAKNNLKRISKHFKFLKALHERSGESFSMSNLCREHKVSTSTGRVLLDNGIITRQNVVGKKLYTYHWSLDVLPNIKMAEKLESEMSAVQSSTSKKYIGKLKSSSNTPSEPKGSLLDNLEEKAARLEERLSQFEGLEESLTEGYKAELERLESLHSEQLDSLSVKLSERDEELKEAQVALQEGRSMLDRASYAMDELEEGVRVNDCREASVEFSFLWGAIKYLKFNNQ